VSSAEFTSPIERTSFGATQDGIPVDLYTLRNAAGSSVAIATYGATVVSLRVPDRDGRAGDVVLGFDDLQGYLESRAYFGAIVGRYANRIAEGRFTLAGRSYPLARNNGENHLHGGARGFDKVVWAARPAASPRGAALELRHLSRDGEEGYPGELDALVTYRLTDDDAVEIEYEATADRATICNLTHHGYFDLDGGNDILGHQLTLRASRFTPIRADLIPTGELRDVAGTPMDFRTATAIGARIDAREDQIAFAGGYDHNWVLDREGGDLVSAATLLGPVSGRLLEVLTTEPGLQFYSGNFLDGTERGKGGKLYGSRSGLCLETQHFPDSPNHPSFPSTELRPGERYRSTTIYRFSVAET
jgi:aldose 1-epimerase